MWVTYKDNTITTFKTFVLSDAAQALLKAASSLPVLLLFNIREERGANSRTSKGKCEHWLKPPYPLPNPVGKAFPAAFPKFPTGIRVSFVLLVWVFYQLSYLAGPDTILSDS